MPYTTALDQGRIDLGDDKTIVVVPRGPDGETTVVDSLALTVKKPSGTQVTKSLTDFRREKKTLAVDITHDEEGVWVYKLEGAGFDGYSEVVTWREYISDLYG